VRGAAGAAVVLPSRGRPRGCAGAGGGGAACGSWARGLTSFTCPECGADLREVGIVGAERPRTGRFVLAAGLWLGSFTAMGAMLGGLLLATLVLSPGGGTSAQSAWAVVSTLLLVTLPCVTGVVWMSRRTKASGTAVAAVLLLWGLAAAALALLGVLARV